MIHHAFEKYSMIFLVFLNDINDALSQDRLNMKNTLYYFWFGLKEKKKELHSGENKQNENCLFSVIYSWLS